MRVPREPRARPSPLSKAQIANLHYNCQSWRRRRQPASQHTHTFLLCAPNWKLKLKESVQLAGCVNATAIAAAVSAATLRAASGDQNDSVAVARTPPTLHL